MGVVLEAEELATRERVAVKRMGLMPGRDPSRRFVREARLLARVQHPHVVRLRSWGEAVDGPYLVMDLIEGATVDEERPPDPGAVLLQLAGAVEALHGLGMLHRDVKPSNVMVVGGQHAFLVDFGLAWDPDATPITATGAIPGTAPYLAPELLRGGTFSTASDWYALGATGYYLFEGRNPWASADLFAVASGAGLPWLEFDTLPPESARAKVLRALLSEDPAARPRSAEEVRAMLAEPDPVPLAATARIARVGGPAPGGGPGAAEVPPTGAAGGLREGPPGPSPVDRGAGPGAGGSPRGGSPIRRLEGPGLVAAVAVVSSLSTWFLVSGGAVRPAAPPSGTDPVRESAVPRLLAPPPPPPPSTAVAAGRREGAASSQAAGPAPLGRSSPLVVRAPVVPVPEAASPPVPARNPWPEEVTREESEVLPQGMDPGTPGCPDAGSGRDGEGAFQRAVCLGGSRLLSRGGEPAEEIRTLFEEAAMRGHRQAQRSLAEAALAAGGRRGRAEAENWLRQAAEGGDPESAMRLAGLLEERGREALPEAVHWYREAALQRIPEARDALLRLGIEPPEE